MIQFITNANAHRKLKPFLEDAQKEILVISPWMASDTLWSMISKNTMSKLKSKKINGKAILRLHMAFDVQMNNYDSLGILIKGFREIRRHPKVHSKILIIDQQYALVSSMNWTSGGMGYDDKESLVQRDSGILTDDPNVVKDCLEHFRSIWKKSDLLNSKPSFVVLKRQPGRKSLVVFINEDLVTKKDYKIEHDGKTFQGNICEVFSAPTFLDIDINGPKNSLSKAAHISSSILNNSDHRKKSTNSKKGVMTLAIVTMDKDIWHEGGIY